MKRSLGPIVDELGVMTEIDEHECVTEVVVLARITKFDGDSDEQTRLLVCSSQGCDWITQIGLIAAAGQVTTCGIESTD